MNLDSFFKDISGDVIYLHIVQLYYILDSNLMPSSSNMKLSKTLCRKKLTNTAWSFPARHILHLRAFLPHRAERLNSSLGLLSVHRSHL